MKQKIILLLVLLIAIGAVGGLSLFFGKGIDRSDNKIACTMEAKLCPDGSAVGRTGPKCEFAKCPDEEIGDVGDGSGTGGGAGIMPYKSGIRGVVTRGPMCPVVRVGEECPDVPYETGIIVSHIDTPSKIFATISQRSDKDGKFLINLPPGDYMVNAVNDGISKTCDSVLVSIGPDEIKNINISCDTGIR